ncbi:MAG: DNA mismatch repair endonuclease MutL [Chlamydiia bacterium]|nr:DNA mismatch repair endonuclease MutL [Chlamydiia bacterium]
MPAIIKLLDDLTINKIAAGEVVQDPASVVKELVENSLDGDASEITVEIGAGGRHLIRITDNGVGMGRDDALLSLERHATSKIRTIDDLSDLSSLGFRGEAVPSIASVSKFSILTAEDKEATLVRVEGGKLLTCEPAARAKGTTVEVKDLFFNVPVRKKFLKSPARDEAAILRKFTELAIARPDVKFTLISDRKPVLNLPAQSPEERIQAALGEGFKEELIPVNYLNLRGYIGIPQKGRPNRASQYLFLNNRSVKSSFFSWAVKEGYSTHLPERRFPLFVLWLTLPPQDIDVNVHPQKLEVRFRDERGLQEMTYKAIREALYQRRQEAPPPKASLSFAMPPQWEVPEVVKQEVFEDIPLLIQESKPTGGRVVTGVKGYLLAEVPGVEGIALIDQERAQARILYEKLAKERGKEMAQEALLIPYTFELSKSDASLMRDYLSHLTALGFDIREFGKDTFVLEAYPAAYGKVELEPLIQEFLDDLRHSREQKNLLEKLSERGAGLSFRQKRVLSIAEGQRLLDDLALCEEALVSPTGKPIRVQLDAKALSKLF